MGEKPAGLLVYNASTGQEMRVWITVRRLIEDSQGLSKPGCCRFHPSFIGACPWCNVVGVRCANTTVYPSFLANASARSEGRLLWNNHLKTNQQVANYNPAPALTFEAHVVAQMKKGIQLRTPAEALASAQRAEALASQGVDDKRSPFKGVSVFCKMFPGT